MFPFNAVLVLLEVEVIFFLVVGTVLWFGFSMRIMLITHWCFSWWVVLSRNQGPFKFPMLCQWAGAQEPGREQSQDSWPELAKGIFHTMESHAQYINQGNLTGAGQWLLGDCLVSIGHRTLALVSRCWAIVLCTTSGSFLFGFSGFGGFVLFLSSPWVLFLSLSLCFSLQQLLL